MIKPDSIIQTPAGGRHVMDADKAQDWIKQFPGDRVIAQEWPFYAWPGGYEIHYYTKDRGVLCNGCANENLALTLGDDPQWQIVAHETLWEGEPIQCDHCGRDIKPEYEDDTD